MVTTFIIWYIYLSIAGFVLIFFRDDRAMILKDLVAGLKIKFWIMLAHVLGVSIILPLTIPFSLGHILNKWLK